MSQRRSQAPGSAPAQYRSDSELPLEGQTRIIQSQGLVKSLAFGVHKRLPPHVEVDDLIAFGQVGLAEAARDFDESRGVQFTTFAYYRIRGAIFDGLSSMSWFSRHHYHQRRYEQMANELGQVNEGPAGSSVEEGARWLGGTASSLAVMYLATGNDDEAGTNGLVSNLEDTSTARPEESAMESELRRTLRELIEALPSDAGQLIRGIYFEGLSIQDAGARLGISKAWASRLHQKSLGRLAHALKRLGEDPS